MTSLKGDLRSIMGTPFGGVGHAVLIFSRVTRAAFNSDSVVLQLHDRIEMPEEADGKFHVDGLDPGPIRIELEGGTVHNHGWNIDLPDEGVWSLTDLVDAQVDWSPAVIGRAEAAARESRQHADRAEAGADRVGTAEQVGVWASEASSSASAAASDRSGAVTARDAAQSARDVAEGHANRAATSETNAAASESAAKQSEDNAGDYAAVATTAATEAVDAMDSVSEIIGANYATREYADSKDWVKAIPQRYDDLNTFTEPGVRPIVLGSLMSTLANRPPGFSSPGYLEVVKSDQTVFQRLTQATPRGPETVERQTFQGAWGEWHTHGTLTRRMYYTDYNALPEGDYDIWTYAQARDMANRPPVVPSSALVSTRRIGDQRMYQTVIGTGVGGLSGKWERYKSRSGVWQEWVEVHTDVSRAEVEYLIGRVTPDSVDTSKVVTIGDSQVGASYSWANLLADVSGLTVINNGVSGYTPDEALIHAGVRSVKTVEPATLPPAVDVQISPAEPPVVAGHRVRAWVGKIGDTPVEFKYSNTDDAFFFRNISTSTVDVSAGATWVSDNAGSNPDHRRIVWFGGNSIRASKSQPWETPAEHVMRAYSDAIFAWGDTTIVCGYVPGHGDTGGRDAANEINAWLSRVAPKQFLDIRHRLQLAAPDILGRALTPSEQQDISNGYLPQGLYQSDLVHLTEEAHVRIAEIVAEFPHGASPQVSIHSNSGPVASKTGAGSPEGKISAAIGSTYTDIAATNGAIRWIKASGAGAAGWRVEYGDTGWRNVTGLLMNGWTADQVLVRRQNNTVTLSALNLSSTEATSGVFISLPGAFHTPKTFVMIDTPTGTRPAFWNMSLQLTVSDYSNFGVSTYASTQTTWQVESDRAWPTTLPGTPA